MIQIQQEVVVWLVNTRAKVLSDCLRKGSPSGVVFPPQIPKKFSVSPLVDAITNKPSATDVQWQSKYQNIRAALREAGCPLTEDKKLFPG